MLRPFDPDRNIDGEDYAIDNGYRAERAEKALVAYRGTDRPDESHYQDLICDLMHLCDRNSIDFDEALRRAVFGYSEESGNEVSLPKIAEDAENQRTECLEKAATPSETSKHSLAPWYVEQGKGWDGYAVFSHSGEFVASTRGPGPARESKLANARLIAAAPELLASLKEMVADLVSHATLGLNEREVDMLRRAESAIAKSEGKAKP